MAIVTDQKLKSYFLGELAVDEAERLEEELAIAADLTEQAQMVESELADEYLRESLSANEHRLFEENYLTTEARREKLRSAEMLWKVATENQKKTETAAPSLWQNIVANYRMLTFGGLAAIVLFGGFALLWLNSNKNFEIARQVNNNQTPNYNAPNQTVETNQNANAAEQNTNLDPANRNSQKNENAALPKPTATPEIKPTPKPPAPPAPTLATFVLLPGMLRSEGEQFIKIAPNTNQINLRLTLPKDAAKYQTYRATFKTADGETVFTASNLKSLNLFLSARKLENQTYLILLEGQNPPNQTAESVAEYTFRVKRQ